MKEVKKIDYASAIQAYIKELDRKNCEDVLEYLKDANGKWDTLFSYNSLIEQLKDIIEYGYYEKEIYEQFVSEMNETNYPAEIKQKILAEIKKDLFSQTPKNKESNKKQENEIKEIQKSLESLGLHKNIFYLGASDYEKEKLSTLPLNIQKKIIKNYSNALDYFTNPSKELYLYAIKEKNLYISEIPEKYRNDFDIQLAIIDKNPNTPVKEMGLLPKVRIEYIKKYPEKIITEITKENFNQKDKFTIYDLSHEELEVYKKALGEYTINKVKENPTYIKEIKNPSKIVKETALRAFEKQYTR
ncbi:MAG: hypothetical protein ACI4N3_04290 [Alphaproteobacteria bacterium]